MVAGRALHLVNNFNAAANDPMVHIQGRRCCQGRYGSRRLVFFRGSCEQPQEGGMSPFYAGMFIGGFI